MQHWACVLAVSLPPLKVAQLPQAQCCTSPHAAVLLPLCFLTTQRVGPQLLTLFVVVVVLPFLPTNYLPLQIHPSFKDFALSHCLCSSYCLLLLVILLHPHTLASHLDNP